MRVAKTPSKDGAARREKSVQGHLKKRATWEYVAEVGPQPLQRCPGCHKRFWIKRERLPHCPLCHGPLEETIKRRQEMKAGFATKREAQEALTKVLASISYGTYIEPSRMLVSEFLSGEWLPAIRSTIRPTTYLSYGGHVRCHIIPALGTLPLQHLSPSHLNAFYSRLLTEGRGQDKGGLSSATVRRVHATLHRALSDAVRWNKLSRNPADAADPPRSGSDDSEMKVWSVKELKAFLACQHESRLYPLWLTLATTGMRRGEVLGLRWEDVNLEARTLSIRQTRVMIGYQPLLSTPKTRRGKRLVALDPATVDALKENGRCQKKERLGRGKLWKDSGYVFTKEDGEPHHPERVSKLFIQAAKRAGLPRIRLHDLRHTYATLALSAGVHPKVVSERLGHANIGITLDCYSHCLPALSEEAACRVAALVLAD
jgi:integrase